MITDEQLKEQGGKLIDARRRVWDLERRLGLRSWDDFLKLELRRARAEYRRLLQERRDLVKQSQGRLF